MGKLILIRHGKSEYNVKNIFAGWTDVDLAPAGMDEAKKAGNILKTNDLTIDVCFSSYLQRAIRTAWIVLDISENRQADCLHSYKLNERHYGDWQGKKKDDVEKEVGKKRFAEIRRGYETPPPPLDFYDPRHPRFEKKYQHIDPDLLPDSESLKTTEKRAVNYYYEAIAPQLMQNRNVMVSAHGNSLRALKEHIEKIPIKNIGRLEVPTGIPYIYDFDEELNLLEHYRLQ